MSNHEPNSGMASAFKKDIIRSQSNVKENETIKANNSIAELSTGHKPKRKKKSFGGFTDFLANVVIIAGLFIVIEFLALLYSPNIGFRIYSFFAQLIQLLPF